MKERIKIIKEALKKYIYATAEAQQAICDLEMFINSIPIEQVDHPSHYNIEGRKECIDEMVDVFGYDATFIWSLLTAYKYRYRKGLKDEISKELGKISWYEKWSSKHHKDITESLSSDVAIAYQNFADEENKCQII